MAKLNCWEFKNCERQHNGGKSDGLGVCSAVKHKPANGVNDGANGGRICWAIAGTICGGKVQGSFAQKIGNCIKCDFYQTVKQEQGVLNFKLGL